MKALSVRQPWADLIIQGKKTLDLRTWRVNYRGPVAIFASQTVEEDACRAQGLDPDAMTTGAVIGVVDLVNIISLDEASYLARAGEHLHGRHFREAMFGWEMTNPRPLEHPQPQRGRIGLFEVNLAGSELPAQPVKHSSEPRPPAETGVLPAIEYEWDPARPFILQVLPETQKKSGETPYRLALMQNLVQPPPSQQTLYQQPPPNLVRIAELGGDLLRAVADQVLDALRRNAYKPTDLHARRKKPFALDEESGVRLGLLFLAVRPLTKTSRVEAISEGLRGMTLEELYYWYSKCTTAPHAERAQKALRMLLAEE